ncbi:MAG: hypothetical protein KAS19_08095 [Anaerolineales bacterium]|nr:hypothetical protein [Anaerolineales bacterium]
MTNARAFFKWTFRLILLFVLFIVFFVIGSMAVAGVMPDNAISEPGLVPATTGLLIIALADLLVIAALILASRWSGWKFAVGLALAYYGAATFMLQIETWYFLSSVTVGAQLLPRLFLMGIPTAFLFIPLAVWILGKGRATAETSPNLALVMPAKQWIWKLAAIAVAYLILYWGAGYFIAWQNPELRIFYGQPGDALPFFTHTANTLRNDPMLFPFQILRALLWVCCTLPVIRSSKVNPWWTALLVGLFLSVPTALPLIIENPLMPIASVRMSHLIEGASSNFIFGTIVVWLLHREHHSFGDLFAKATDSARTNTRK